MYSSKTIYSSDEISMTVLIAIGVMRIKLKRKIPRKYASIDIEKVIGVEKIVKPGTPKV